MDASGGDPPPRSRLHPPGTLAGARRQEQSVTQRFGNPTIGTQRKSKQFKSARVVKTLPRTGVLLPTFLTSARWRTAHPRGSVSFGGYRLPRMTGHDLVCSLHWRASPWISRRAGSITNRTALRRTFSTRVNRRSPPVEFFDASTGFRGL